jgi:hypothetical protein
MGKDLRKFIREQAEQWKKTEAALRKLGYGPALDHDKALLESMGRIVPPESRNG